MCKQTLENTLSINVTLDPDFIRIYNIMQWTYGPELARLNGFAPGQLNYTEFIDNFIDESVVSDASIDGSANKVKKDVVTLENEMAKPHEKVLAFNKIYYEHKKLYGKEAADKWFVHEYIGKDYLHDSNTSSFKSYCFAYDLKRLAEEGLFFINPENVNPPKHLMTFVDFIKEYINFTSNRTSGAVGLPNLLAYMYYFWREDVKNGCYYGSAEKFAKQHIQRFIYGVNQPYTRDGIQSAFTNSNVFDKPYLEALFGGSTFPDGSYMIDDLDGIMQFQKWYMEERSAIIAVMMYTFPVNSISILKKECDRETAINMLGEELVNMLYDPNEDKYYVPVDMDFAMWAINHNIKWNDSNIFCDSSVSSLSNCCRLKNDITELYFNSIGGTALKVGSVKVNTINLARIAYESNGDEEKYIELLKDELDVCMKALHIVRHIIIRNVEKGLLNNFGDGLIEFKYLYNTIGFIGIYETMKYFGYTHTDEFDNTYYDEAADKFGKIIFDTIHNARKEFAKDKDYTINTEQIPGESAAAKLMKKDILFFGDKVVTDLPLYGNQFIPLGVKTTIEERVRVASLFDSYCNGGSILHINIDAPFNSFDQAWYMFLYIIKCGVTYYAFNGKIRTCKHGHSFYEDTCPICGEHYTDEWTRIVGFYTKVSTYSSPRKAEYHMRKFDTRDELLYGAKELLN